jgi:hypothetical protein
MEKIQTDILGIIAHSGHVGLPDLIFRSDYSPADVVKALAGLAVMKSVKIKGNTALFDDALHAIETMPGAGTNSGAAYAYIKANYDKLTSIAFEPAPALLRENISKLAV